MLQRLKWVIYLGTLLLSSNIYAADIEIMQAWTRASAPGIDSAAVDLQLRSKQAISLIGAKTAVANSTELHVMQEEHGVMTMREIKSIPLPAGTLVSFSASGTHLMLIGLKKPLKAGTNVPLTLIFRISEKEVIEMETEVTVKPLTSSAHHHHH